MARKWGVWKPTFEVHSVFERKPAPDLIRVDTGSREETRQTMSGPGSWRRGPPGEGPPGRRCSPAAVTDTDLTGSSMTQTHRPHARRRSPCLMLQRRLRICNLRTINLYNPTSVCFRDTPRLVWSSLI